MVERRTLPPLSRGLGVQECGVTSRASCPDPRLSNPATYTKVFGSIREVFALTQEARAFGYDAGRFSFNVKGGRCESCEGDRVKLVEMHFLADVYVPCEVCGGKRFNDATLGSATRGRTSPRCWR